MNKKQRRLLSVYKFNRILGLEVDEPILPLVILPLPPNSEVQFAPCKKQREKDTCYWVKGHKKKWDGNKFTSVCLQTGCGTRPSYGMSDDENERPTYCSTHKLDGMEDIVNKRCIKDGCGKQPSFGMPEDKRPT
jgi:hypothetical protein